MSFPRIYLGEPRKLKIDKVTPYYMAKSEIRRRDRRGVKPEHVLHMAKKVMRLRLKEGLGVMFKNSGDTHKITRNDIEDRKFIENCVEHNWAFMKSIPNSVMYWGPKRRISLP
jgi:isopropylmalate/homocitrate/citramalate synthase